MSFNYYVGSFTLNTGTGNQSITGVGFTPKVVMVSHCRSIAFGYSTSLSSFGYGFSVGTSAGQTVCTHYQCGLGSPATPRTRYDDTKILTSVGTTGTLTEAASMVSLDSDGFTINVTTAGSALVVWYVCIGGSLNANIMAFQSPSATGNQSYTGAGFQPNTSLTWGVDQTTTGPTTQNNATISMGVCDSALDQSANSSVNIDTGGSTNTSRWQRTDSFLILIGASEAQNFRAAITSWDSDGFTANWAATAGSGRFFYALVMNGIQSKNTDFTQKTSTGSQAYTGIGFQGSGLILGSLGGPTATPVTIGKISFGSASGSSNLGSGAYIDSDASNPSNTAQSVSNSLIYASPNTGGSGNGASTGFTSFDADGWTLPWAVADATARHIWSLTLADAAAGGATPRLLSLMGVGS